jgi:Na+/proline symporter
MGHWLLLLSSRRYAYMFIGLGCWLIAAVSMAAGKTLERFYGVVSRDQEPKRFRRNVVGYFIVGLFFVGLSLIAFYLHGPPYFYF